MSAVITFTFQSPDSRSSVDCQDRQLIADASPFLQTLIEAMGEAQSELVLPEENPFDAAKFLRQIILDSQISQAPSMLWNQGWAELSVKWMCERYIAHFAQLAFHHIEYIRKFCAKPEVRYKCCAGPGNSANCKSTQPKTYLCNDHYATHVPINKICSQEICFFWEAVESTLRHKQLQCAGSIATTGELLDVLVKQRQLLVQDHMVKVLSTHDACALAVMLEKLCK